MTCTRSKMYFKNQKGGPEEGLTKQNVHLMHCIYESEAHNWSAGFPSAHALWCRFESTATVANIIVSLGIRSLVLSYTSR